MNTFYDCVITLYISVTPDNMESKRRKLSLLIRVAFSYENKQLRIIFKLLTFLVQSGLCLRNKSYSAITPRYNVNYNNYGVLAK